MALVQRPRGLGRRLGTVLVLLAAGTACSSTRTVTRTETDRRIDPDGTVHEQERSVTEVVSDPRGGTVTINLGGVEGSVSITAQDDDGSTTETEVAEGSSTVVPPTTKSVTTTTETTKACSACGRFHGTKRAGSWGASFHRFAAHEFRVTYGAWPDPLSDISASVSVRGHGPATRPVTATSPGISTSTPRRVVREAARDVGEYFRNGRNGRIGLSGAFPAGDPLPSFPDVDVIVREILLVEPTSTGATFHYYDVEPFERIEVTLNGATFDLRSSGAMNSSVAVNGWFHAAIPIPASALSAPATYGSTIVKRGSRDVGDVSEVLLELETP